VNKEGRQAKGGDEQGLKVENGYSCGRTKRRKLVVRKGDPGSLPF